MGTSRLHNANTTFRKGNTSDLCRVLSRTTKVFLLQPKFEVTLTDHSFPGCEPADLLIHSYNTLREKSHSSGFTAVAAKMISHPLKERRETEQLYHQLSRGKYSTCGFVTSLKTLHVFFLVVWSCLAAPGFSFADKFQFLFSHSELIYSTVSHNKQTAFLLTQGRCVFYSVCVWCLLFGGGLRTSSAL